MKPGNCPGPGYLQMGVKVVERKLSGLRSTCYLYAAMDMWSRYRVGLILPKLDEDGSLLALYHCTERLPVALRLIQTEDIPAFRDRFHDKCVELGLEHAYVGGGFSHDNAALIRSFRTDVEEFFEFLEYRPDDYTELNAWYQDFLRKYNTNRPHQAIGYDFPDSFIRRHHAGP